MKDTTAPTGYSASFDDPDDLINSDEQSGVSFSFADAEVDASYSYSINDSDDTTDPIIGSGVIDASDNQITAIDVSSLSDGDLTLTVSLTDPAGNVGTDVTDAIVKDTTIGSGASKIPPLLPATPPPLMILMILSTLMNSLVSASLSLMPKSMPLTPTLSTTLMIPPTLSLVPVSSMPLITKLLLSMSLLSLMVTLP